MVHIIYNAFLIINNVMIILSYFVGFIKKKKTDRSDTLKQVCLTDEV
jgi:hypothetical protein